MKFERKVLILVIGLFLSLSSFCFGQLDPVLDFVVPCHKVLQIDQNTGIGINFILNESRDIVVFDANTGTVLEKVEGVIYAFANYGNFWYFYIRRSSSPLENSVYSYSSGTLNQIAAFSGSCYNMWPVPDLNGVVGSTPTGMALFSSGQLNAELTFGEPVLNLVPEGPAYLAITRNTVNSIDMDFDFIISYPFPDGWQSFEGAWLNGDFLVTDSVPFGYPDRSLAIFNPQTDEVTPIVNQDGEEISVASYLLPTGIIDDQFLLSGNGQLVTHNYKMINPTGCGLVNPVSGVFSDLSGGPQTIRAGRLQPILKQTQNGPVLFGRMGYEGIEPYRVTTDKVEVLKDIYPGFGSSMNFDPPQNLGMFFSLDKLHPLDLVSKGGNVFFSAISPGLGQQIWRSDGTAEGTVAISNFDPERKGFSRAFLTDDEADILVSIINRDNETHLYKLNPNAPAVNDTIPNEQNWEVTYTTNPETPSGVRTRSLNHPEALLADDGSIGFVLEETDTWRDYFSLNQKWVLAGTQIQGNYFNTVIQIMEPDGSLRSTALIRAWGAVHRLTGRRPDDGHFFVMVSCRSASQESPDIYVNQTQLLSNSTGHFLIELDSSGALVKSKFMDTGGKSLIDFSQIKVTEDGIYLLGFASPGFDMGGSTAIPIATGFKRAVVFKYDENMNPVWIKPLAEDQPLFGPGLNSMDVDETHVYVSSGGVGYNVSSTCGYSNWIYKIAGLQKSDGNISWERTCEANDVIRITHIKALGNDQLWLGGYTRGDISVGGKSLSVVPNYLECSYNGFLLCLSKANGAALYLRNTDSSRAKFLQDIDFKDGLLYCLSMVYEENLFPVPIWGYDGRWSLQIDRLNTSGILVDSLRWPTSMSRFYLNERLSENKFGLNFHPGGGVLLTGQQIWNGTIDGFTAMPTASIGLNTWLIQRRNNLHFLKVNHSDPGSSGISVFPNPTTTNSIGIQFSENDIGKYQQLYIYSIDGRPVLNQSVYSEFNNQIIELKESMADGIYLLKLTGSGGSLLTKFMILR